MAYTLLLVSALAAFAVLSWRRLEFGVLCILFLLPSYLIRFTVFGVPITFLEAMILLLFFIWLFKKPNIADIASLPRFLVVGILLLLCSATLSLFISPDVRAALGIWKAYFIEPVLFFCVFITTLTRRDDLKKAFGVLALSAVCIASVAVYQKFTGWHIPPPWDAELRVTSLFPYPNAVGLFVAPIAAGAFAFFLFTAKILHKITLLTVVCASILAMVYSQTKSGLAALSVTVVACGMAWSAMSRRVTLGLLGISGAALIVFPQGFTFLKKLLFFQTWSEQIRLVMWKETLELLAAHPITGAGLAGYQIGIEPFHTAKYFEIFLYPHMFILTVWSELGILGVVSFFLIIGWFFFALWKVALFLREHASSPHARFMRGCVFASFAAMLTLLIHGMADVPYFKNDLSVFFWFLLGSAVILYTKKKELLSAL